MNPQLSAQDVFGLDLRAEAEQATGQLVLGDGIVWKDVIHRKQSYVVALKIFLNKLLAVMQRHS